MTRSWYRSRLPANPKVIPNAEKRTLHGFTLPRVAPDAEVFTDEAKGYTGIPNHTAVNHSVGQYVDGGAHVNGMQSFWSMLRRGYHGVYHRMSPVHLQRNIDEFTGRHNQRALDTEDQMRDMVRVGRPVRSEHRGHVVPSVATVGLPVSPAPPWLVDFPGVPGRPLSGAASAWSTPGPFLSIAALP